MLKTQQLKCIYFTPKKFYRTVPKMLQYVENVQKHKGITANKSLDIR